LRHEGSQNGKTEWSRRFICHIVVSAQRDDGIECPKCRINKSLSDDRLTIFGKEMRILSFDLGRISTAGRVVWSVAIC
jgi:hypothetical protein